MQETHLKQTIGKMIIGLVTIFSSFGPVIALSALTGNLTQTLASGDRLLNLLNEEPVVKQITNGSDIKYESLKVENLSFFFVFLLRTNCCLKNLLEFYIHLVKF